MYFEPEKDEPYYDFPHRIYWMRIHVTDGESMEETEAWVLVAISEDCLDDIYGPGVRGELAARWLHATLEDLHRELDDIEVEHKKRYYKVYANTPEGEASLTNFLQGVVV